MSKDVWENSKKMLNLEHKLEVGPYYTSQILFSPRHLLFTLARYKFAAKMLPKDRAVEVLELGCGEGFGTMTLTEESEKVVAVDFDENAINHAQSTLSEANISFICDDFLGKLYGSFDAAISLDVIEHIYPEKQDAYMETLYRNLSAEGFCLIGTPNETSVEYASEASKAAHVNMFTAERLTALVGEYFTHVFIFGMNDEVVHTGFYPMSHYLIALGCGKKPNR
jgi:2-polyprenyl-3-methyl-5-hydroxy-6-metoxy-1,4-benzoquinol methylase